MNRSLSAVNEESTLDKTAPLGINSVIEPEREFFKNASVL